MTEMKRATPKTVDGRRLRSDPLLNISPGVKSKNIFATHSVDFMNYYGFK